MRLPPPPDLARRLQADVGALCRPEGRVVGSRGHAAAERLLEQRLAESGCAPYAGASFRLPYHDEGTDFVNLVGVVRGGDSALPPLLLGAHYDSVIEAPCADDNGAAVAICLALAEAAAGQPLPRDLIVALFDAEEPPWFLFPAMGSNRFFARQLDDRGVHFALVYDLVGHDVTLPEEIRRLAGEAVPDQAATAIEQLLFMTGAESAAELAQCVQEAGLPDGLRLVATLNDYVGDMSDHGVFRRNGVPYLFFSCGRWRHYHQPTDTPDRLNYDKMARIAGLSAAVLQRVADQALSPPPAGDPTLPYELKSLHEGFAEWLPLLLPLAGINRLETRADLGKIVAAILSLGL